ncbi:MAG TPA: hypothetical protein VG267_04775 [Terracidiphilus sp.]|jgi:hypothetical protein|nr:hypothetical protein [Terracidiphilus sp.]
MRTAPGIAGWALLLFLPAFCAGQSWKPLLAPDRAIDWSRSGVGEIPTRPTKCATLKPGATVEQINAALAACSAGQTVYLGAGTFAISGTLHVPSNVTLRGAGADQTILNAVGAGAAVIAMGSGGVPYRPRVIRVGAIAGSTQIELVSADGISAGTYIAVAERNDPAYVTSAGSGGNCNWCDGRWTKDGAMARGQIVEVTAVSGNLVTIAPALYAAYTHEAVAVPFAMATRYAGVEDLQVRANNTGYATNFLLDMCAYCWLRGVESNYADGDHVTVQWGYRDEVRDSYFSNAYLHVPGAHDSDIEIGLKTSASLIENNIIERTHTSVMPQWGAAGNVIAYNYTMGEFDSEAPNVVTGGVDYHGAHPQFNLLEGNVLTAIYADSVWGSSSDTTAFRNWIVGTNRVCTPLTGRAPADCANGHYGFQAARAVQLSYLSTRNNLLGNVIGSARMQALKGYSAPVPQAPTLEYPQKRPYETAVGITFGYGSANDDGTGTGCAGGTPPCHAAKTSATDLLHGNFNNAGGTVSWIPGLTHALPASFYLAKKPDWWGRLPFPATGPDVTGGSGPGGHSYGNPAQACYMRIMGGSDGGAGSPLEFNARRCYGPTPQTPQEDPQNRE